jgi:uncharacterized protein (DUF1800 family)
MHPLQKQNHLYWRAGFGPVPAQLGFTGNFQPDKAFKEMLNASANPPEPFTIIEKLLAGMGQNPEAAMRQEQMSGDKTMETAERRKAIQQKNRQGIRDLNLAWMNQMIESPAQLREKMAFFWHGHFACRTQNSFFSQQLLNTIRTHALSDFGTLLAEVSKSAAMLQFLNNQQNRKYSPNENFAREVMELFTMGRGNYTEQDVKEAARAFTGWGFNLAGAFQFRQNQHDEGLKTILGKTGNFDGEAVLKLLLEQPATAKFICTRLFRFFVNDTINTKQVDWLAKRFFDNGYQIKSLLTDLFTADWFYAKENTGTRIKSPVELWVGIRRQIPMQLANPEAQLLVQRALGQVLFYPPNVAGWPGGKTWIDSSSLLLRMRLPQLFSSSEGIEINFKADDDTEMGQGKRNSANMNRYKIKVDIDWKQAFAALEKIPEKDRYLQLAAGFLQSGRLPEQSFIEPFIGRENYQANLAVAFTSLPEYQLC